MPINEIEEFISDIGNVCDGRNKKLEFIFKCN